MKKGTVVLRLLLAVLLVIGLCSCQKETRSFLAPKDQPNSVLSLKEYRYDWIVSQMPLEERVGQLLVVEYRYPDLSENFKQTLLNIRPGGFILFGQNISTYERTLQLIKDIKATAQIPMFISIDQEGGIVDRLINLKDSRYSVFKVPSMRTVGRSNNPDYAYQLGKVIGKMCRVFGINMDFAPVADILINKNNQIIADRSFGSDEQLVSEMAIALARGLESEHVIAVFKHYPGHGSTQEDSHVQLPVLKKSLEELWQLELQPFKKAVDAGATAIMAGHIVIRDLHDQDDEYYTRPATLDPAAINGLLRTEMGYQNLVITDSLQMFGAYGGKLRSEEDILIAAVNAGCDLLLCPVNAQRAYDFLLQAVKDGRISEESLNESVIRILKVKDQMISDYDDYYLEPKYLNDPSYSELLKQIKGQ